MNTPQPKPNRGDSHINSAKGSLRQSLTWYSHIRRQPQLSKDTQLQTTLQKQLDTLTGNLNKLDTGIIRIAAFGLVSRGKSSVLNALMEQKILQTGPINGITQWPRTVRWTPNPDSKIIVELTDTPGLDEVEGETRAQMAKDIARQSDLILFIVAGDITRTEYKALTELRKTQKPLILVFNKIDLYPEQDRNAIYQQLQELGSGETIILPDEIVMVAAEPIPLQVRVEWPDGTIGYEWETPEPIIDELKLKILEILNNEGKSLLALNALIQAKTAQTNIAQKLLQSREEAAEKLIWDFAKYKALAVGLNPIAFFDLLGGVAADLVLIRSLAKLYGLPMTGYEASKLWKTILFSSGGLLLGELGSGLILGIGKTAGAAAGGMGDGMGIATFAGSAIAQGSFAGYGAYSVGQAAKVYLEQGCTWGPMGPDTIIQTILNQAEPDTIIARLKQEIFNRR